MTRRRSRQGCWLGWRFVNRQESLEDVFPLSRKDQGGDGGQLDGGQLGRLRGGVERAVDSFPPSPGRPAAGWRGLRCSELERHRTAILGQQDIADSRVQCIDLRQRSNHGRRNASCDALPRVADEVWFVLLIKAKALVPHGEWGDGFTRISKARSGPRRHICNSRASSPVWGQKRSALRI